MFASSSFFLSFERIFTHFVCPHLRIVLTPKVSQNLDVCVTQIFFLPLFFSWGISCVLQDPMLSQNEKKKEKIFFLYMTFSFSFTGWKQQSSSFPFFFYSFFFLRLSFLPLLLLLFFFFFSCEFVIHCTPPLFYAPLVSCHAHLLGTRQTNRCFIN